MYRTEAKYFDGQSSLLHQVILLATERFNEICLQFADGSSIVWNSDDLDFERYGDSLEIRNKQFSGATLQIKDDIFVKRFWEAMTWKNRVDIHHRILGIGFSKIVAIAVAMLALIVVAYFYILPPIAEKSAALLPESFDTYLGNTFMGTFYDDHKIDTAKTAHLEKFAAQINFENRKPLHFSVVKSKEINAFALPNGHIVVYSGILDKMQNSSELAALLAHEAAHINNRHSTKMLCRNLAGYILISLIFSDVNGIMAVLADNAQQLHSLSYSRKFESEADEQGLKILMANHIDPNGMTQLFALIEREEKIAIPKILSTHPLTAERKENMQEIIKNSKYSVQAHHELELLFEYIRL